MILRITIITSGVIGTIGFFEELGTDSRHRSLKIAVARIDAISTSRGSSGRRVESAQFVNMKNLRKRRATDASMARVGSWPSVACIVYLPGGDSSWRGNPDGKILCRTERRVLEDVLSSVGTCSRSFFPNASAKSLVCAHRSEVFSLNDMFMRAEND